jgi:hypothetical protein
MHSAMIMKLYAFLEAHREFHSYLPQFPRGSKSRVNEIFLCEDVRENENLLK